MSSEARLDVVERRLTSVIDRYLPYLGLVIGTIVTPFVVDGSAEYWLVTGGLVAVTAAWSYAFTTRLAVRASDSRTGAVYVAGLLVLLAALVFQSPFYGFHALAAYVHSFDYLRGRWRFAGVGVTAVLTAYAQIGGRLVDLTTSTLLALLGLVVVNAVLTGGFTYFGALTAQQSARRRQVISELELANRRLAEALEENGGLQVQLLAQAREAGMLDERQRMAREIHDTLAQGLTGIVAQLEAADATDGAVARGHLSVARSLARESLTEARRSVQALRPEPLEHAHLPDAVRDLAKRWAETSG
ncbi:MAG: histidine kinase, partial [Actinomycetota bacterium]|nr:histidine kinase [Actinomycetota bacterium]